MVSFILLSTHKMTFLFLFQYKELQKIFCTSKCQKNCYHISTKPWFIVIVVQVLERLVLVYFSAYLYWELWHMWFSRNSSERNVCKSKICQKSEITFPSWCQRKLQMNILCLPAKIPPEFYVTLLFHKKKFDLYQIDSIFHNHLILIQIHSRLFKWLKCTTNPNPPFFWENLNYW